MPEPLDSEPIAIWNGATVLASEIAVPVYDLGFVQGVAVSEQLRTFQGKLFRLDQHLERLQRSLSVIGIADRVDMVRLESWAHELVEHNYRLIDPGQDLGLALFVTPGPYATLAPAGLEGAGPTIGMHTYPLPFYQWAAKYSLGQKLVISTIRQTPPECWPPELKCRSRMHYYLADQEAERREAGARAVLLDLQGNVMEASTANIVAYHADEGLLSPPREAILPGISVATLRELAAERSLPFVERGIQVDDLLNADEVFLCSTSPCVWPVVSIDGHSIGNGEPGPLFAELLSAWSDLVGLDIRRQAESSPRPS